MKKKADEKKYENKLNHTKNSISSLKDFNPIR